MVIRHDEGFVTAVTLMNSSQGRVPALLQEHHGHGHGGRWGERARASAWCGRRVNAPPQWGPVEPTCNPCAPQLPPGVSPPLGFRFFALKLLFRISKPPGLRRPWSPLKIQQTVVSQDTGARTHPRKQPRGGASVRRRRARNQRAAALALFGLDWTFRMLVIDGMHGIHLLLPPCVSASRIWDGIRSRCVLAALKPVFSASIGST